MNAAHDFWYKYFADLHGREDLEDGKRVGMSNDRVSAQEYALILESCGPISGKRCLDVGCGLGQLARCLAALGGRVEGLDYVEATISRLKKAYPEIEWLQEDLTNPSKNLLGRSYAVICICEVLQHLDALAVLQNLWHLLEPGGRMVGFVPNSRCPIVQRVQNIYPGFYRGVTLEDLQDMARQLPGCGKTYFRGAAFCSDQSLSPYELSSWNSSINAPTSEQPNRLQFVLIKQALSRDAV